MIPIVTKQDFERGFKVIVVKFRWGTRANLQINSLAWRDFFRLSSEETKELGVKILLASIPAECRNEKFLESLAPGSLSDALLTAKALAIGVESEDEKKSEEATPANS